MDKLKLSAAEFLLESDGDCDAIAVGVLDFNQYTFHSFELMEGDVNPHSEGIYFDLASLTKPLTNSFVHIAEKIKDESLELILNHEAGLPSWGLLSRGSWKEQILSYPIKKSSCVYSDYSALRYMLEIENKMGVAYKELALKNLSEQMYFWKDLPLDKVTLQNGFYHKQPNTRAVHDPNAFNIGTFMSHAGLFGTVEGLCRTLIQFSRKHDLIKLMNQETNSRFNRGFDTVTNPEQTLAGSGCSKKTFGHLGFTGTSFWIDPDLKMGHVILTNSTKKYWYHKSLLNRYRKEIGSLIWAMAKS